MRKSSHCVQITPESLRSSNARARDGDSGHCRLCGTVPNMPQKIVVLQSRTNAELLAREQRTYAELVPEAEWAFVSTLDERLSWQDPEAVVGSMDTVTIGGSGEFDFDGGRATDDEARRTSHRLAQRLRPLVNYALDTALPTLGICFGHQLVAEIHGVSVVHDPEQANIGSEAVTLTEVGKLDVLLAEMPETFVAQYGHKDSLSALPGGATLLATGERCRYSALRYTPAFYTFQFHPELTAAEMVQRLSSSPGYLPDGGNPDQIVRASPEASLLIPRFIEHFA